MITVIIGADFDIIEKYKDMKTIVIEKNLNTYNSFKIMNDHNITLLNRFIGNENKVISENDYRVYKQTLQNFIQVQRINEDFNLVINVRDKNEILPQLENIKQIKNVEILK